MAPHSDHNGPSEMRLVSDGEVPNVAPLDLSKPVLEEKSDSPLNGFHTSDGNTAFDDFAASIPLNHDYAYTPRKLRVITIGAGFSGLLIAHKFEHRFPALRDLVDHTVLEARSDVGGTW